MKEATGEPNEIKIHIVSGGRSMDQHMLKGCYFYPSESPNKYNFYSKFDMLLASDVENGKPFEFTLGPFSWKLVADFLLASGKWSNSDGLEIAPPRSKHDTEGEGTFQVQTGGHVEPQASYASA